MSSILLVGLAELFVSWPKWSKTDWLDRSLFKAVAGGDVKTGPDGEYTLSETVTESVWTVRRVAIVSLFTLSVLFALFHKGKQS
jgi:hypothetical protein